MSRVLGVLSGKGGVGKTTLVANLGATLTKDFGRKTIIIDGNVTTSNLGLHLGIYEDLKLTLKDVLDKKVPIIQAIYVHPATGMRILPAPLHDSTANLSKLNSVTQKLKDDYEIVILDCAPGLGKEVVQAADSVEQAIVITTPELPAVTDALKAINLLEKLDKKVLGIVLNRVRKEKYELTTNEIESTCNYKVIASIPEDKKVPESIADGVPLVSSHPYSPASSSIKRFAAFLLGEKYAPKGFWYSLKKMLGLVKPERKITEEKLKEVIDIEKLKKELAEEIRKEIKKKAKKKVQKL